MTSLRIKIVHDEDIIVFKSNTTETEIFNKINEFVKNSYKLDEYRLVYKDKEGDEITITDDDDLQEAIESSTQTTKLFVRTVSHQEEEKIECESTQQEENNNKENNNDNNNENDNSWLKFLNDISNDKELKEEFISFLSTFILSLQEIDNSNEKLNGSEIFIQSLSIHDKLSKHPIVIKFVNEKLNTIFIQFPHILNFLKNMNPDEIEKMVDLVISFTGNRNGNSTSNQFPMLPPFLFPFLGNMFNGNTNNNNYNNNMNNMNNMTPFGGIGQLLSMFTGNQSGGFGNGGFNNFFNNPTFNNNNNCRNNKNNNNKKDNDLRADIIDENITLGKNAIVVSNRTLIKTWKMKNVGNKSIPSNISVENFGKKFNPMIDGHKFELNNKEIKINQEFEVSIVIKSPNKNGKYTSNWRLVTKDGIRFGQILKVSFFVNDENNSNDNNNNSKVTKEDKQQIDTTSNELLKETDVEISEESQENIDNDNFVYQDQLIQLKNMGFSNEEELKKLLNINKGSVEAVLNSIM